MTIEIEIPRASISDSVSDTSPDASVDDMSAAASHDDPMAPAAIADAPTMSGGEGAGPDPAGPDSTRETDTNPTAIYSHAGEVEKPAGAAAARVQRVESSAQDETFSKQEPVTHEEPETREEPATLEESFADVLSHFEKSSSRPVSDQDGGRQVSGTVIAVSADSVFVDIGYKTEGVLPVAGFAEGEAPKLGDKLTVTVKGRNEEGYYELSRLKMAQPKDWSGLEAAYAAKVIVAGTVTGVVKGGLSVDVGVRAFMPASRSGARDAAELEKLVGQEIRCRIIKLDVADDDVVVDRRAVVEEEERSTRERRYSEISEGESVHGTVRSLTDYGAFVEIGGVDALLHVSDISWTRVVKPSDVLTAGQEIDAIVLKVDAEKRRISIGMKQLQPHPWDAVAGKYKQGDRVHGTVSRIADFGAFVELEPGVEGMIHLSEMSWAKKVKKASDMMKPGEQVEAVILGVDVEQRRLSLGLKQALGDPWAEAEQKFAAGSVVEGPVVSFTKFGAFVQVAEGVEGMIHVSEITADKHINHPQDVLKTGQVVKAQVLEVNKERRQLKLSMKKLIPLSIDEYMADHKQGDVVTGRVVKIAGPELSVELGEGIVGLCRVAKAGVIQEEKAQEEKAQKSDSSSGPDLSALSSMLKARWKGGAPSAGVNKPEPLSAGQIRSFRIGGMDVGSKKIELTLV